ncbi:hypothetical protein T492DRAFT_836526 [Pavlovales sp. CCMP2436]|nr:hypothetical protein T492DRAFT_836526 [Pavlovales sp. CCMP2436]
MDTAETALEYARALRRLMRSAPAEAARQLVRLLIERGEPALRRLQHAATVDTFRTLARLTLERSEPPVRRLLHAAVLAFELALRALARARVLAAEKLRLLARETRMLPPASLVLFRLRVAATSLRDSAEVDGRLARRSLAPLYSAMADGFRFCESSHAAGGELSAAAAHVFATEGLRALLVLALDAARTLVADTLSAARTVAGAIGQAADGRQRSSSGQSDFGQSPQLLRSPTGSLAGERSPEHLPSGPLLGTRRSTGSVASHLRAGSLSASGHSPSAHSANGHSASPDSPADSQPADTGPALSSSPTQHGDVGVSAQRGSSGGGGDGSGGGRGGLRFAEIEVATVGAADTGAADTGAADTGAADTGAADTGAADTGAVDSGASAAGLVQMAAGGADSGEAEVSGEADSGRRQAVTDSGHRQGGVDSGEADTDGRHRQGGADRGEAEGEADSGHRQGGTDIGETGGEADTENVSEFSYVPFGLVVLRRSSASSSLSSPRYFPRGGLAHSPGSADFASQAGSGPAGSVRELGSPCSPVAVHSPSAVLSSSLLIGPQSSASARRDESPASDSHQPAGPSPGLPASPGLAAPARLSPGLAEHGPFPEYGPYRSGWHSLHWHAQPRAPTPASPVSGIPISDASPGFGFPADSYPYAGSDGGSAHSTRTASATTAAASATTAACVPVPGDLGNGEGAADYGGGDDENAGGGGEGEGGVKGRVQAESRVPLSLGCGRNVPPSSEKRAGSLPPPGAGAHPGLSRGPGGLAVAPLAPAGQTGGAQGGATGLACDEGCPQSPPFAHLANITVGRGRKLPQLRLRRSAS